MDVANVLYEEKKAETGVNITTTYVKKEMKDLQTEMIICLFKN